MSIRLPLEDLPNNPDGLSFQMELEGDVFRLEFRLNAREDRYYLKVLDEDEAVIASSVAVVVGRGLLGAVMDPRRPRGEFFVVVSEGDTATVDPTGGQLGSAFDVVFTPWTEVLS